MKLTRNCLSNIGKMLDFYSQFNPSPLSIKQFIDFGECSFPPFFRAPSAPNIGERIRRLAGRVAKWLLTFAVTFLDLFTRLDDANDDDDGVRAVCASFTLVTLD